MIKFSKIAFFFIFTFLLNNVFCSESKFFCENDSKEIKDIEASEFFVLEFVKNKSFKHIFLPNSGEIEIENIKGEKTKLNYQNFNEKFVLNYKLGNKVKITYNSRLIKSFYPFSGTITIKPNHLYKIYLKKYTAFEIVRQSIYVPFFLRTSDCPSNVNDAQAICYTVHSLKT